MYDGFEDVNESYSSRETRRTASYGNTGKSGYTTTGVEARDYFDELVRKSGILREQAIFFYRANVALKQVSISVVKVGVKGEGAFKRSDRGYTFHLGGVFAKYPELRPLTPVKCPIFWGPDGKALILSLGAGTAIVRRSRTKAANNEEK
ncbi:MAG: hypothetical protein K0R39_2451 [Symbiobacteriaceae bacterium]|jgi:hypothetical protein|nr:hypothetical protein [Symbiobacteriaceae bacterium]